LARKMGMHSRSEFIDTMRGRYKKASWSEKGKIIDDVIVVCEFDRKHVIKLLNQKQSKKTKAKRWSKVKYNEQVVQALVTVWYAANQICSKRLVPFLAELVTNMEKHGHLDLQPEVKDALLMISHATVDRLLKKERHRIGKSPSTTKAGNLLKHQIPVRTFADWDDVVPGFFEADLVAHNGGDTHGAFLNTLVLVDISTYWLEFIPLLQKNGDYVIAGLDVVKMLIPFPLLGVDTDNGSEFINHEMINYCESSGITFTRGRAYKKNDQAFVEEKNGSVIRRLIGYDRYEGQDAWRILTRLYRELRLYVNFFQPSLKLLSKHREGAHVARKYEQAQTPYQRVLMSDVDTKAKRKLTRQYKTLDAVTLLEDIQTLQKELWTYATTAESTEDQASKTPRFYRKVTKIDGRKGPRHWKTRRDPFEDVSEEIEQVLEANPCQSAASLHEELMMKYPDKFGPQHLRSMQRRVVEWRRCKSDPRQDLKEIMLADNKAETPLR